MGVYNRVLAVINLDAESEIIARRALQIVRSCGGSSLTLLHVVEFVPVEPLSDSLLPAVQIESELLERARDRLGAMAAALATPPLPWRVATGNVKSEILRIAREDAFDLIVIGSHERHGVSILVNLTEDTVLHAAPCDVLAVRLPAVSER